MHKKSCVYLQSAIYFAPLEIRACCQRFFFEGKIKGDVAIIDEVHGEISYESIQDARKRLIDKINTGEDRRCDGCRYLIEKDWKEIDATEISIISIEDHSICNMRCTYCSDTYYGGKKAPFNILNIINEITNICENLHIAWGGGEPTVRDNFEDFFNSIDSKLKPKTQRIFTNSLIYSNAIQRVLNEKRASITTSIDAGSEEVFREIRGAKKINRVFENLSRYSKNSPELITIKYILTELNSSIEEINKFVQLIKKYNLQNCNFLISSDFKQEKINDELAVKILYFYYALQKIEIYTLTFDDHIFNRLRMIGSNLHLLSNLDYELDFAEFFEKNTIKPVEEIIIWGTGEFSKYLINSSIRIKNGDLKIHSIVDGNISNVGKLFEGYVVSSPNNLINLKNDLVIASSNYYGEIIYQIKELGIPLSRIRPNFIL